MPRPVTVCIWPGPVERPSPHELVRKVDLICLAAGKGSRLGGLGSYLQKCMYPVGLKPFLHYSLEQLVASGLPGPSGRLMLVVGHLQQQVRAYFGSSFEGLALYYVEQRELLGTGDALRLAGGALDELDGSGPSSSTGSVVAWQADLFVPRELFSAVGRHEAPNATTLAEGHIDEPAVLRATVAGPRLRKVWQGEGPLVDIGLWKLERRLLARLATVRAANGEFRMLPNLQRCMEEGTEVGYVVGDEWVHLGGTLPTPEANVRQVVARLWRLTGEHEP